MIIVKKETMYDEKDRCRGYFRAAFGRRLRFRLCLFGNARYRSHGRIERKDRRAAAAERVFGEFAGHNELLYGKR